MDAVYIATPHTSHLQNASDALQRGKAVLCEKPITVNATECQQLIDTAGQSSTYLMEAMWTWFLPAIRRAKEWVDAGRIGKIVRIHSDFGYPQEYHPDKVAHLGEELQELAHRKALEIQQAYRQLRK